MASELLGSVSLGTQRPIRFPAIRRGLPLILVRIWCTPAPRVLPLITRPSPFLADALTLPCVDQHHDPNVAFRFGSETLTHCGQMCPTGNTDLPRGDTQT